MRIFGQNKSPLHERAFRNLIRGAEENFINTLLSSKPAYIQG